MSFDKKARLSIVFVLVVFLILVAIAHAERPAPLDPNSIPFATDPNSYTSDLLDYVVGESGKSFVSTINIHNKGGWLCNLAITMSDGSPTSTVIQRLTERPVKDPNEGWNQEFQWAWTPPSEGVFYLELIASTIGKPEWKTDRRTVVVYAYGEDIPYLWVADVPELSRMIQAQRLWQYSVKLGTPLTNPTNVWR